MSLLIAWPPAMATWVSFNKFERPATGRVGRICRLLLVPRLQFAGFLRINKVGRLDSDLDALGLFDIIAIKA